MSRPIFTGGNQGRDAWEQSAEVSRRALAAVWPWLAGPALLLFWSLLWYALLGE